MAERVVEAAVKKIEDKDLLTGPLINKIFSFVIPLILTNLLQTFYSAADMIVVGLSNVDGAIGSIGTTGSMINMIANVFMGFATGSGIVVARYIGARDPERTGKAVHTSLVTGLVAGIICMILGLVFSRPILIMMGDEGHILELATLYARIYFLCVPFLSLTNFLISIFRAKGDTKTPLFVLSFSGLLNIGLNLYFVLVMKMSVDGVAIATAISNFASMLILLMKLKKDPGWCGVRFSKLRIDRGSLKAIIVNGLPAGLQGALFSLSNMIIQSSIISLNNMQCPGGSDIIDGNAAGVSLESFAYTAVNSVTLASITFMSQHYGAHKFKRAGQVMRDCYLVAFMITIISMAILIGFQKPLLNLYVSAPLAVQTGETRIRLLVGTYFTLSFMDIGSGMLRGLNRSILSTVISLMGSCLLRIVWIATVFEAYPTIFTIYLSYPVSWLVTGTFHLLFSIRTRKQLVRQYGPGE